MEFQNRDYNELKRILLNSDEYKFEDRLRRLKYLTDMDKDAVIDLMPAPDGLSASYREEAGTCYVEGNFIAAIAMVNLTFDALLRAIFRSTYLDKRHLDNMDFSELIDKAVAEGYITADESRALHHIRKDICEPYTHIKTNLIYDPSLLIKRYDPCCDDLIDDEKTKEHTNDEIKKDGSGMPSFQIQEFKITDPCVVGKSVEEEAKESLSILGKLLPHIVRRNCNNK
jgi:hypothetical protein